MDFFFLSVTKGASFSTWRATCSCCQCTPLCNLLRLDHSRSVRPSRSRRYRSVPLQADSPTRPGFQSYSRQPQLTSHNSQPHELVANTPHLRALMDYLVCGCLPPMAIVRDFIPSCFLKKKITLKIHVIASPFASCESHPTASREN